MTDNDKRNEIIRIFRKYVRLGLDSERLNPIQVYKRIDIVCISRRSKLEMLAVYDLLRILELNGERDTIDAIRQVYFYGKNYRLTKTELGGRVSAFAREKYCDDRTVYRRLEKARDMYEKIREKEGLILDASFGD